MNDFVKRIQGRLLSNGKGYGGLKELSKNLSCLIKIIDDYSYDPVQMEKELNNFYYTKSDELRRIVDYFEYVETSMIPIDIFEGYFPSNSGNWREGKNLSDLEFERLHEEIKILQGNFDQLGKLDLKRLPSFEYVNKSQGIEKSLFKDVIEDLKKRAVPDVRANANLIKLKKMQINIPKLPEGLKWEEITIRFLDGNDVQITTRDLFYPSSFELMGFKDGKTKNPTKQWDLLKLFSTKGGMIDWKNNYDLDLKTINKIKKQKQELSDKLKLYFNKVEGDPFSDYRKEGSYKIKINLIPEQGIDLSLLNIADLDENDSDKIDADILASSREDWD